MKYLKPSLFVLAACCIINVNAQSPSGKLSLKKGQQLQMKSTVKTSTTMDMMGQSMEMTADAVMVHAIEVKGKKENSFLLNSTLTKMKSNINAMGQSQSFDSDKKEDLNNETGKMMKGMLNVTKEVELNSDAKAVNVKEDTATEAANAGMMQMLQGMMGGAMNDASGAADAFLIIPADKKKGDSWSDSVITEEIKIYRTFTLKEINGNKATVVLGGNQTTSKKVEQMGMEINVTMDAKLTGETIVDITTGVIEQKNFSMDGAGTSEMMGQSIPMTTKLTSAATVKTK